MNDDCIIYILCLFNSHTYILIALWKWEFLFIGYGSWCSLRSCGAFYYNLETLASLFNWKVETNLFGRHWYKDNLLNVCCQVKAKGFENSVEKQLGDWKIMKTIHNHNIFEWCYEYVLFPLNLFAWFLLDCSEICLIILS